MGFGGIKVCHHLFKFTVVDGAISICVEDTEDHCGVIREVREIDALL